MKSAVTAKFQIPPPCQSLPNAVQPDSSVQYKKVPLRNYAGQSERDDTYTASQHDNTAVVFAVMGMVIEETPFPCDPRVQKDD